MDNDVTLYSTENASETLIEVTLKLSGLTNGPTHRYKDQDFSSKCDPSDNCV